MATVVSGGRAHPPKRRRLSRSAEFDRVFRDGRSYANRYLVLHEFVRSDAASTDGSRLGLSVGRKVGGAVARNRIKRLLREAFWSVAVDLPPGRDYILVARPDARELAERGEHAFEEALSELLGKAGLVAVA